MAVIDRRPDLCAPFGKKVVLPFDDSAVEHDRYHGQDCEGIPPLHSDHTEGASLMPAWPLTS